MTVNRYNFESKVVLVTGGGTGIGRAIAHAFLDNGATVIVAGRRTAPLEETIKGYPKERAFAHSLDVADSKAVHTFVDDLVAKHGHLDVVVSDAALYTSGELVDLPEEKWHQIIAANVDGLFYLAQATLPHLVASKGNVVAISSVSGSYGDWGQAAYNASKHAVNGLIRSLALDYGAKGVRLNLVAPAFTLTAMASGVGSSEKALAPFINRIALARPGVPEDIAPAVLFLASDDASYITGSTLTVDGGTSASTGQPHVVD